MDKWKKSEQLEMISNQTNTTLQMANISIAELKEMGYEIITSMVDYKPKRIAGVRQNESVLRLDKRKTR